MSYFSQGQTELISRPGYSSIGADEPSWFDKLKDAAGGALNFYGQAQAGAALQREQEIRAAEAAKQQQASSGTPSWVLPVAIGGVALVAVVLLTRKKS